MPIIVMCPGCNSRISAPDAAAGKTVKCPKCKEPMVIPEAEADAGFEEVIDEPAPAPKKPAPVVKKKIIVVDDDDDEDEKPRAKKKPRDDDDEDDEDDEDDRPKKKGKGKKKAKDAKSPAVLIGAIVGGVLLLGGGFAIYWFAIREDKPKETASTPPNLPPGGPQPGGPGPGGVTPPGPTGTGGSSVQPSGPVKPVNETSSARSRSISNNNLKQIGLAFHNFASSHDSAFPAGIHDAQGNVGLSWRVAILPYVEQDELYKQFHRNEPWDSEHNKTLIPKMPKLYAAPGTDATSGKTYYRSFVGAETGSPPPPRGQAGKDAMGLKIFAFTDGLSNTAVVVEAGDPVDWTKPDELVYTPGAPLPRVSGIFGDGFHITLGDGSTRWLKKGISAETLKAIITAKGGEVVDFEK